ncbi:MAG: 30S ribosomal protein S5 [Gammaproteobacteria bacterium]
MASFDSTTNSDGLRERLVAVNRNSKVVKGGRKFSFSAVVVVGDGNGKVGYGRGKGTEVPVAIQKAMQAARKSMRQVPLNGNTLHYEVKARHGATRIVMFPAVEGTGIIAGGPMRAVFEVLGVENVSAKVIGSTNPVNVVRAAVDTLAGLQSPQEIAHKRGKSLEEIMGGANG